MNKAEVTAAGVVLALGIALFAGSLQFPVLSAGTPGPGFLPLLIAIGVIASGVALLVGALRGIHVVEKPSWPSLAGWRHVALMLVAMTIAFLLLEELGFLVATTLFMAAMIYALGERSWRMLLTIPPFSALALYMVFAVWLRVPLPKGLITFIG
jgi:putative tricarboxylic transport membrane protein